MTWQLAECADTGPMMYEFQTGSNQWWTSFWVRNARVPLAKVEVQSANHAAFIALDRVGDGTLTDASGFGEGQVLHPLHGHRRDPGRRHLDWPSPDIAGAFLTGKGNFK